MNFVYEPITQENIQKYLVLFGRCFPGITYSTRYLEWLYFENPNGSVIGFDAFHGRNLVAHYACIPIFVRGRKGLLSLNTATAEDYRSNGLFSKLAKATFEKAEGEYEFIVGVANEHSTKGFIERLGFDYLGSLNLRIGPIGQQPMNSIDWCESSLNWRLSNPRRKYQIAKLNENKFLVSTKILGNSLKIKAIVNLRLKEDSKQKVAHGLTLDWSRFRKRSVSLPKALKPSPLNLICRSLNSNKLDIDHWDFLGFDVF
jgi:Acetyltransferase (GNAT) domain